MAVRSTPWLSPEPMPPLPWLLRASKLQVSLVTGAVAGLVVGGSIAFGLLFLESGSLLESTVAAVVTAALASILVLDRVCSGVSAQQQKINDQLAAVMKLNEHIRRTLDVVHASPQSSDTILAINKISQSVRHIDSVVSGILRCRRLLDSNLRK
jgi:hypothetical protein